MQMAIKYGYVNDWDILSVSCLSDGKGKYEGSYSITEDDKDHLGLVVDVDSGGRCLGIEFFDAAELLLPHLLPERFQKTGMIVNLVVEYRRETDTLFFHNGTPANHSEAVTEGWTAHYSTESEHIEEGEIGEVVGFTVRRASETLLPHLLEYSCKPANTSKRERMRSFRKTGETVG
jgi:uncharacterized protein YuzE